MRINEAIRQAVIDGIAEHQTDARIIYTNAIMQVKAAEDVEEIVKSKYNLLDALVRNVPLDDSTCYFCRLHDFEGRTTAACVGCEYAVAHKTCCSDNSDYISTVNTRAVFLETIRCLYYKGESYLGAEEELPPISCGTPCPLSALGWL